MSRTYRRSVYDTHKDLFMRYSRTYDGIKINNGEIPESVDIYNLKYKKLEQHRDRRDYKSCIYVWGWKEDISEGRSRRFWKKYLHKSNRAKISREIFHYMKEMECDTI